MPDTPEEPKAPTPPPAAEALEKLKEMPGGEEIIKSVFTGFAGIFKTGPDPETARVIAETEMHEENTRLEGFKAALNQRDKDKQRDYEFRVKKLNRDTAMRIVVLIVAVAAVATGLYLVVSTQQDVLGTGALVAGLAILFQIIGRPFLGHE